MLETFMRLFLEYNQKVNLISRNDSEYLFEKHIYDSLSINLFLQRYVSENKVRMLDIGTGGGFPSIPVAICIDRSDVTAVDSTLKKIKFLE